MAIKLYYSNDIYTLSEQLAGDMDSVKHRPLEPVTVFIPNPYMRDWLMMRLALLKGIAANIDFVFLNSGLWKILSSIDADSAEKADQLERKDLRLLIYSVLTAAGPGDRDARPLVSYLSDETGSRRSDFERRAWQLSDRLASLFLRYEEHRPELTAAWMKGRLLYDTDMERAQSAIYRRLFKKEKTGKMTLPRYTASIDIEKASAEVPALFFFCESQLSRFHGQLIGRLGAKTDIYFYQINPCWEYWEDMETPSEERWKKVRSQKIMENREGEYLESDEYENRLLRLWGKAGREDARLMSMLEESLAVNGLFESNWLGRAEPDEAGPLLSMLQQQVLNRRAAVPGGWICQDTSLQIAASPSLFREVESVYNSILFNLETDPDLKMTDIAVFVPDMEQYGPVIKSVFFRDENALAFSIIDYNAFTESFAGRALLSILDCASGDVTRSLLFSIFFNPCFQKAWNVSDEMVELWLNWADRLNIFRSLSGDYLEDDDYRVFTWHHGLKRLRFGRILESRSGSDHSINDYRGIAPYEDMNSSDVEAMGLFSAACELVSGTAQGLAQGTASAREWARAVSGIMRDFMAVPDEYPGEKSVMEHIQQSLAELEVLDRLSGGEARLSLSFIREYIQEGLKGIPGFHGRYLTGGVNISSLVPRRQIPFKVAYVLGMGEGIFPGAAEASSLDIMADKRRIGDLTTPDLNSYLFFTILMSTEKKCYLSYVARDLQKDEDLYANSLVHQLVSYIEDSLIQGRFRIATVPLNGFDPLPSGREREDDDGSVWSDFTAVRQKNKTRIVNYSCADMAMLTRKLHEAGAAVPEDMADFLKHESGYFPANTGSGDGETAEKSAPETISVHELSSFLNDPAPALIRRHLRLFDSDDENTLEQDDEPLYSEFYIKKEILGSALESLIMTGDMARALDRAGERYRAASLTGMVPGGAFGGLEQDALMEQFSGLMAGTEKKPGLGNFLHERRGHAFYRAVSLGMPGGEEADLLLPALRCTVNDSDIEVKGRLPLLWTDKKSQTAEALVFSMAGLFQVKYLLYPYIFYLLAAGGLHEGLHELMGRGDFIVHVALRDSVESCRYSIRKDEARDALMALLGDYLDASRIEHMPLAVVFSRDLVQPYDMTERADEEEKISYYESFNRALKQEEDGSYASYRPDRIVSLARPAVPADVYDRVFARFSIFSRSLMQGGE